MTAAPGSLALTGARLLTPDEEIAGGFLVVEGGRIAALGGGQPPPAAGHADLGGAWVVPGFVDLHVHGGGGADLASMEAAAWRQAARFHAAHGTTALLATLVAPLDRLDRAAGLLAAGDPGGAELLGLHLEGPFLNPARAGALSRRALRDPAPAEVEHVLAAGGEHVRLVTLAPELPGGLDAVRAVVAHGAVAALGHSDASYEQARAAIAAGARHATHLFNAMRGLHHREPGLAGAALEHAEVGCELIADGLHLHPAVLGMAVRLKGAGGAVLVTDAVSAAGMPDGTYRLGDRGIALRGGRAELEDGGALAGSTLTMDAAVRNAVRLAGVPLATAVRMAATNPAAALGLDGRKGRLRPGMDADLVVLDDRLTVRATLVGGRLVHGDLTPTATPL